LQEIDGFKIVPKAAADFLDRGCDAEILSNDGFSLTLSQLEGPEIDIGAPRPTLINNVEMPVKSIMTE